MKGKAQPSPYVFSVGYSQVNCRLYKVPITLSDREYEERRDRCNKRLKNGIAKQCVITKFYSVTSRCH